MKNCPYCLSELIFHMEIDAAVCVKCGVSWTKGKLRNVRVPVNGNHLWKHDWIPVPAGMLVVRNEVTIR